jgi:cell division protein ZipA
MDIQIIALLVAFGIVSFIAALVIRQNRYYARLVKRLQKEPTLGHPTTENTINPKIEKEPAVALKSPPKTEKKPAPMAKPKIPEPIQIEEELSTLPSIIRSEIINEKPAASPSHPSVPVTITPREFIVLTLLAKPGLPYTGYELLQALLAAGLRFGKISIFHRHEKASGQGEILFSLASAVEPGTFELNRMGSFSCLGLTLFLRLRNFQQGNKDVMQAFDLMMETARQLADDLGGEVCDEHRQLLTEEKINAWRSYLAYYERSRQIPDLFA